MMLPNDPEHPFWSSLPPWVTEFRPHQFDAVHEILEAYERGAQVVELDAPVGAGKTLIAEMVGIALNTKRVYVCTTKSLQDQVARDFDSVILKGKANYETETPGITADDCIGKECKFCSDVESCPYEVAKGLFRAADLGVTNTSYLLGQVPNAGKPENKITYERGLVTIDECDELESTLVGSVEVFASERTMREWGIPPLKKGVHAKTQIEWLRQATQAANRWASQYGNPKNLEVDLARQVRRARRTAMSMAIVAGALERDPDLWVRDYIDDSDAVSFKPVLVGRWGRARLWSHAERFLAMSGTIISPEQWSADVGIYGEEGEVSWGMPWEPVTVPMMFPVENRPIMYAPVASMKSSGSRDEYEARVRDLVAGIEQVLDKHDDVSILVHTVSYPLTRSLYRQLTGKDVRRTGVSLGRRNGRPIVTYQTANARDDARDKYLAESNAVILAPSMDRGVDFRDDHCRVVIVAKIPFPNLGDRRISARLRLPGGQGWYATQVARTLVQMTGRGVRSADDWATSYILDGQFGKFWHEHGNLLPRWWRDAVEPIKIGDI